MKIFSMKNITRLVGTGIVLGLAIFFIAPRFKNESALVLDFNSARDTAEILELFEKDRYWLTATEGYSPERMLMTRSPNEWDDRYTGALTIKVLQDQGKFAGFFAYYQENLLVGKVLFVAVKHDARSKGYGYKMLQHAVADLCASGVHTVRLITRTSNLSAMKLYRRFGFVETSRDEGYVNFSFACKK